jgi:uncharacterized membrane protein YfcA
MEIAILVGLTAIALVAFATEGAIGFGGTVIAASIGAQLVSLDELLPAFVPINMALSAWLLGSGLRAIEWRLLLLEIAPAVVAGALGGLALLHVPSVTTSSRALACGFGVFVVGLAALRLLHPIPGQLARPLRIVLLALGGLAHGMFGTGGPMIVYVVGRRVADKRAFRATLAVLWFTLNAALLANFASLGRYESRTLDLGVAIAIAIVPGLVIGERVHRALDAARFERIVWWLLLVAGAALALRSALA